MTYRGDGIPALRTWLVRLTFAALVACGGGGGDNDDDTSPSDGDDDDEYEPVPCTPEYVAVQPGTTTATAGEFTVRVVTIKPDRVRQHLNNDWEIEVTAAGQPVSDVQIVELETFMPAHGHYGTPAPRTEKLAAPGRFKFDNLRVTMPGPWDVNFKIQRGATSQSAKILVCVE